MRVCCVNSVTQQLVKWFLAFVPFLIRFFFYVFWAMCYAVVASFQIILLLLLLFPFHIKLHLLQMCVNCSNGWKSMPPLFQNTKDQKSANNMLSLCLCEANSFLHAGHETNTFLFCCCSAVTRQYLFMEQISHVYIF